MIKYDFKTYEKSKGDWDTFEFLTLHLIEEMSEVTKEICKINRYGLFASHPKYGSDSPIERLRSEIKDVEVIIHKLKNTLEYNT